MGESQCQGNNGLELDIQLNIHHPTAPSSTNFYESSHRNTFASFCRTQLQRRVKFKSRKKVDLLSRNDQRPLHNLFATLYNLYLSSITSLTRLASLHQFPRIHSNTFHLLLDTVSVYIASPCCITFMCSMYSRRFHKKRKPLSH